MTYLFRKFVRELKGMRFRGILIILSVGLSIGIYGGLLLVKDNAFASRDNILNKTNYEDGRIKLINPMPKNIIENLLKNNTDIKTIDFRYSISATVSFNNLNFPSLLHNIDPNYQPKINNFVVKEGNFSSITNNLLVEKRFADANNLHVGDSISIKYDNKIINTKVGAIVFAPEHMYSANPTTSLPEKGVFAPLWFSIDNFAKIMNTSQVINEVLLKVNNINNLKTILNQVVDTLQKHGVYSVSIAGKDELDYSLMKEDVGSLGKFAVAIGLVILLVAIFIIYDSILKIINAQTTMIGILRALGATVTQLLVHYISFGMVLTLIGVVIGLPIGYLITLSSTSIFVNAIGFEVTSNIFHLSSFMPSILIALSVTFITSFIGTLKIAFMKPVEAIDNQTIKEFKKGYFIEKAFDKISKNKYSTKIPIRQVFRRKRRTILTALTIAIAALIILSSFGFLDSFFHQMDGFYAHNSTADMEVSLINPMPIQNLTAQMNKIQGISHYEGIIRQSIYVYGNNKNETSVIYAYETNTTLRHYTFKSGSLKPGEVAIGQILADKLGVGVGDSIQLLTNGKSIQDSVKLNFTISGITEEFFDNFVFMNLNYLQRLIGNVVNGISISISGNSKDIQKELYNTNLPIATIINLEQSKASFESLMEAIIGFAYFVIFLGIIVLILFSLNVIVLDVNERESEFVNIKINGGSFFIIAKIITLQIALISVLVMLIDYFLSPPFTQFIIESTMKKLAYIQFYMTPVSYGLSIIAFIGGISIGLISAINSVTHANIVESMRIRFKN